MKWQVPERSKTVFTFPDGGSELGYDAQVDLDNINELAFMDAATTFLNAIRSHSTDYLHGGLFIRMPSVDRVFGIDLGYGRNHLYPPIRWRRRSTNVSPHVPLSWP